MAPLTSFRNGSDIQLAFLGLEPAIAQRVRELGLREGVHVAILQNSDKLIVRVSGSRIGLRRELAMANLRKSGRRFMTLKELEPGECGIVTGFAGHILPSRLLEMGLLSRYACRSGTVCPTGRSHRPESARISPLDPQA